MKVENELAGLKGTTGSARLFARAQELIASGVNSTARAPRSGWSPYPLFVESGKGSRIVDVDGNEYVDYLLGLGPMLLGHRPEPVTRAVVDFIEQRGTVFALPVADEIELARKIIDAVPSVEQMHLANSGTEAVLYSLRLARAYTRRKKIIRFEGMYHGFSDAVYWSKHPPLDQAGPASQPVPVPQGPGMPEGLENSLIILPWNDGELLERTIRQRGEEIAAVLTEPIMCNTGCILPEPGYLELMRGLTRELGIVLIFDEVITGFRVALGGAQQYYGITPDLTVMAKGFGGGFPVAAVGGKKEIMQLVADGTVSMAGTYSGNGIAVSAANATLDVLMTPG
ncbi:MAG TPA: aminotransferase class III-fold pyridoxal phosphate-dependent enzyme, partial [Candidatus Binatia bacterium]|nr:aminotransferase class III-fold pyridoxal phosphate-dependent enzyme [Candidatus Binatia bacterium]